MISGKNPQRRLTDSKKETVVGDKPTNSRQSKRIFTPGSRILGGYNLLELIDRGGMGIVYKAQNRNTGQIVALKEFLSGEEMLLEDIGRFQREIKTTARLKHTNIIKVHDFGVSQSNRYWFTMDYIPTGDLSYWLQIKNPKINEILQIGEQIASAIEYAHSQGIIHRDLKPSNILMTENDVPVVMDFGLAKEQNAKISLTHSGVALGTFNYMPPEQAEGKISQIDARSDVYSLGAILYQMLTYMPPFVGSSDLEIMNQIIQDEPIPPRKINPDITRALETITLKCLEKSPKNRYQSAAALAQDLNLHSHNLPIKALPPGIIAKAGKSLHQNRTTALSLAGLFVITVSLIAFWLQQSKQALEKEKKRVWQAEKLWQAYAKKLKEQETEAEQKKLLAIIEPTKVTGTDLLRKYDLMQVANRHLLLGNYNTAANLYQDIINTTPGKSRLAQAIKGRQQAKYRILVKPRLPAMREQLEAAMPKTKFILHLTKRGLTLEILSETLEKLPNFTNIPLEELVIYKSKISNLSPLQPLPLTSLTIANSRVKNLLPLTGSKLEKLIIFGNPITDLSLLKSMPLKQLDISDTKITTLNLLSEIPLTHLALNRTRVVSLKPISKMPLKRLEINGCQVNSLKPLAKLKTLKYLALSPKQIFANFELLRKNTTLNTFSDGNKLYLNRQQFFAKYKSGATAGARH